SGRKQQRRGLHQLMKPTPLFQRLLAGLNVGCLWALWTGFQSVLNGLAFFEAAESEALDSAVVCEDVSRSIRRSDEAEALFSVEPFHGASGHSVISLLFV